MMSDETGKTKAIIDLAASNQRMRELLQKVAGIAEAALANQPHEDGTCWRALSKALSDIRKALRPEPGTLVFMDEWAWFEKKMEELRSRMEPTAGSGAFFTNEKVLKEVAELVKPCEKPLDPNAPEMVRGGEPDEKKAGGAYIVKEGAVKKTDPYTGTMLFTDGTEIPLSGIFEMELGRE